MRPCTWLVQEFISTHRTVGEKEYVAWLEGEVNRLRLLGLAQRVEQVGRRVMVAGLVVLLDVALWGGALWLGLWVMRLAQGGMCA